MNRNIFFCICLAGFFSLSIFGQITTNIVGNIEPVNKYVKGDILIKFKSIPGQRQAIEATKTQLISKYNSKVVKLWKTGAEHWKVDTLQANFNLLQIIDSLNANPFVEYAEPNYILRVDVIPNDPSFGDQWALNNTGQNGGTPDADIDAPEAWDITNGDTNIIVGVIDTGIDYEHEDLEDNIWTNWDEIPDNGIDDDNNGYIDDIHGWDFINNDNDPMDDNGHGTHVAGTIGAVGNNGIGIAGVAWDLRMMALKCFGEDGLGPTSAAVSAVEYATANGTKLTNNSWGGGGYSQTLYDAIAHADTANVLFVAGAGNDARDNDIYSFYPSNYELPNIISVASTDRNDNFSGFSNYGLTTVDIAAPGSVIYSTMPNNTYGNLNGTSMAAPHVSGGIVLAWAQFPGFSNHQIIHQILGSSDQKENLDGLMNSGSRLNLFNAVVDTNMIGIEVNNRSLEFGALILGNQSVQKEILITNMLDEPLLIDSIVCDTGFLITQTSTFTNYIPSFTISNNQVDTIKVVFNPLVEGTFNQRCKIYYKTSGMISRTVTIFLSGYCAGNGTIINAGTVSGIWEKALSPYFINGNISVDSDQTLIIEPGVNVLLAGYYKIEVSYNSKLLAIGSETDSIYFQAVDTAIGWLGLDFLYKEGIIDSLSYCVFKNGNATLSNDNNWQTDPNGGAIYIINSSPFISNCSFNNNNAQGLGGGIYIFGSSFPVLARLKFINNSAYDGGAISIIGSSSSADTLLLNNIVFINNWASYAGGAMYQQQRRMVLKNLTFYNNSAVLMGGAMFFWSTSNVELNNSILYGNNAPNGNEISLGSPNASSELLIKYSNVDTTKSTWFYHNSNWNTADTLKWGIGNISTDTLFVDINTEDLTLRSESPCIDGGDPNDDVGEEPFPNGYRINMGYKGGTIFSTGTTEPGLAITPNPLDFGNLTLNETKQLPLFVKNGSPITIHISDISLSDTSKFKISTNYITPDTLSSGQVDSVMVDFSSDINLDSLYQISITISTNETPDYTIPVDANILIGTNIISNIVSGIWTVDGSPYNIFNNISVETNNSLIIEPGVIVRFMGKYYLNISESDQFIAQGTQTSPIYFTAYDTINGWYGIDIINSGNDDVLEYCNISRGNADGAYPQNYGGALYISNSNPIIKHSDIENNNGIFAAAIYINASTTNFYDVNILNNHSGDFAATWVDGNSNLIFENCEISGNTSNGWGGGFSVSGYSTLEIKNSLINNNSCINGGGGIMISSASLYLTNVTLVNNLASYTANEITLHDDAHIDLINTIIYNDVGITSNADIAFESYPNFIQNTLNISYSNIDTLKSNWVSYQTPINALITWGAGNTTLNPQFTDVTDGIFTLDGTSPCIDAGLNDSVYSSTDIDGKLRIWDGNGDETATVDMGAYEYGAPFAPIQEIELNQGWNIFSSYVDPMDTDMLSVLNQIISSSQLIKVIDESGDIVQNIPGMGWMNTIGNMENTEGYYVKTTQNTSFSMVGAGITLPFDIPLQTGWNIMGYPVGTSSDAMTVFSQLITPDSTLVKVIDESGGFMQYIPGYGWMNTIDSLAPGEGYYIKVSASDTLVLTESTSKTSSHYSLLKEGQFYHRASTGNPYLPMHIVANFDNIPISEGDELGVFINDVCIGSAQIVDPLSPVIAFLTTDDPITEIIDGGQEGEVMTFKLLHHGTEYQFKCNNHNSEDLFYQPLETRILNFTLVGLDTEENNKNIFSVSEVIPNPFSNDAKIQLQIPETGKLKIDMLNLQGIVVKQLFEGKVATGKMKIKINGNNLNSGMYFIFIEYTNNSKTENVLRKVVVVGR